MPTRYDDRRLLLKRKQSDNSGQHLVAGLKGLGFGMLGGLTSVITEPIQVGPAPARNIRFVNLELSFQVFTVSVQGAASSGVPGFLSGLGWGAVGVVTKPVIGAEMSHSSFLVSKQPNSRYSGHGNRDVTQ